MGDTFGKYKLRELLARGGMAEIHLAVEKTVHKGDRLVVLKRILPSHKDDPDFVEFFHHEARVALQLSHPNIVQAYEFGEEEDTLYLAMEYVRGHTVLDVIRRAASMGRQVSLDAALKIAADVAGALDYVHRATDPDGRALNIVHRDVSPHNIVIAREGTAKLADFGIARASIQEFKTRTGVIKGKFAYLAPEMLKKNPSFDHRADLFALGTVTYELITRRPLFRGANESDTVKRILAGRIPPLRELRPDCPAALEAVVHRALERDPDHRYATGGELQRDLEEAARVSGLFPTPTRLRVELEALFEDNAPTSIWSNLSAPPISAGRVARGSSAPDRPPAPPPRSRPPTLSPIAPGTPPAEASPPPEGRAPSAPLIPLSAVVAAGPAPARPALSKPMALEDQPTPVLSSLTGVGGPALAPVLPPPMLAVSAPIAMPAQPRLASPQLDAPNFDPEPLPDRQLEYFLKLASARRSRASTSAADSSPEGRLPDEALMKLFEDPLRYEGLNAVPEPAGPSDTSKVEIDTGALRVDAMNLPLPAPPDTPMPVPMGRPRSSPDALTRTGDSMLDSDLMEATAADPGPDEELERVLASVEDEAAQPATAPLPAMSAHVPHVSSTDLGLPLQAPPTSPLELDHVAQLAPVDAHKSTVELRHRGWSLVALGAGVVLLLAALYWLMR
jgi:serine/threonine-protein kinase